MSGTTKITVFAAIMQWPPLIMYALMGEWLLAAIWIVPVVIWGTLVYARIRDDWGIR